MLIAKARYHVSTKMVYTNLRADELVSHPDIDEADCGYPERDLRRAAELMGKCSGNRYDSCISLVIGKIKEKMMAYGPGGR